MITVSDNDAANTLVNWLGNGDDAAGMSVVNQILPGTWFHQHTDEPSAARQQ